MSPSLLSTRLRQLTAAGLVHRRVQRGETLYQLTEAGQELRPIVEALGAWGIRWIGEIGDEDLDPRLLLWDMHRNVDHAAVPEGRSVVEFGFSDVPPNQRRWWLVLTPQEADVCDDDPGFPVAVSVRTSLRQLVRIWRGDTTWAAALRGGALEVDGPAPLRRAVPTWFTLSSFAGVPRPSGRGPSRT